MPGHPATRSYQPPTGSTQPWVTSDFDGGGQARQAEPGADGEVLEGRRLPVEGGQHRLPGLVGPGSGVGPLPAGGGAEPEGDHHVGRVAHRGAALGEELVGAGGGRAADGAGDDHHLDAAVGGLPHRVHGAAGGVGLDHDDQLGQGRDDPVAGREPPAGGAHAERGLAEEEAVVGDAGPEVAVPGRVDDVEATAHHPHRRTAGVEHPAVGGAVDAQRQAGHHGHPQGGELAAQLPREPRTGAGAAAGADDGDPGADSASRLPRAKSTAGGSTSWRRTSG